MDLGMKQELPTEYASLYWDCLYVHNDSALRLWKMWRSVKFYFNRKQLHRKAAAEHMFQAGLFTSTTPQFLFRNSIPAEKVVISGYFEWAKYAKSGHICVLGLPRLTTKTTANPNLTR